MDPLQNLRLALHENDRSLLRLMVERQRLVREISKEKLREGMAPYAPAVEASRDNGLRAEASRLGMDPCVAEDAFRPLHDDALRRQCGAAALALEALDLRIHLAGTWPSAFVEALDSLPIARVTEPEGAWVLAHHAFAEAPQIPDDSDLEGSKGYVIVTCLSAAPFRGRVQLTRNSGDGTIPRRIFEALGASVEEPQDGGAPRP